MSIIHVVFNKEALETNTLADKVVVVYDVLLATTTIVSALHHGAKEVVPVHDELEARSLKRNNPNDPLIAGEWNGQTIKGFLNPFPTCLQDQVKGKSLILSSTNGTVAIRYSEGAAFTYIGSLLNGKAVAKQLLNKHDHQTIILVCSGSRGHLALEDVYGAGLTLSHLIKESFNSSFQLTDAAKLTLDFYQNHTQEPEEILKSSSVGKMMVREGFEQEIIYASQCNTYPNLPIYRNERVVNVK